MTRRWGEILRSDDGTSLTEMMVAMTVFTMLLGVVVASIAQWTKATVDTRQATIAAQDARNTLNRIDRLIASADAINRPVTVAGTREYLEFRRAKTADCHQFRLDKTAKTLHLRSWPEGNTPTNSWQLVADNLTNTNVFTLQQPTEVGEPLSQVLSLNVQFEKFGIDKSVDVVYVARNTNYHDTVTVKDVLSPIGQSDVQVCVPTGARP